MVAARDYRYLGDLCPGFPLSAGSDPRFGWILTLNTGGNVAIAVGVPARVTLFAAFLGLAICGVQARADAPPKLSSANPRSFGFGMAVWLARGVARCARSRSPMRRLSKTCTPSYFLAALR
jgi:hypothetical protein